MLPSVKGDSPSRIFSVGDRASLIIPGNHGRTPAAAQSVATPAARLACGCAQTTHASCAASTNADV